MAGRSAARRPGASASGAAPQELVRKLADLERESATRLREYKELAGALEASRAETAGPSASNCDCLANRPHSVCGSPAAARRAIS